MKGCNCWMWTRLGLTWVDRTVLLTMIDKFSGGPVGLDTLAASTGEDALTIEDVYEPFLLQLGLYPPHPQGPGLPAPFLQRPSGPLYPVEDIKADPNSSALGGLFDENP